MVVIWWTVAFLRSDIHQHLTLCCACIQIEEVWAKGVILYLLTSFSEPNQLVETDVSPPHPHHPISLLLMGTGSGHARWQVIHLEFVLFKKY